MKWTENAFQPSTYLSKMYTTLFFVWFFFFSSATVTQPSQQLISLILSRQVWRDAVKAAMPRLISPQSFSQASRLSLFRQMKGQTGDPFTDLSLM